MEAAEAEEKDVEVVVAVVAVVVEKVEEEEDAVIARVGVEEVQCQVEHLVSQNNVVHCSRLCNE